MLLKAIRWSNGMVTAFDELGRQIPELQGAVADVMPKILNAATTATTFLLADWRSNASTSVTRERFAQGAE